MATVLRGIRCDADRLNLEIARRGVTAQELAQRAGVSPHLVGRARRGAAISPDSFRKLAKALRELKPLPGAGDFLADNPGEPAA